MTKTKRDRNPMTEVQIDLTLKFRMPQDGLNVNAVLTGPRNASP